MKPAKNLKAEHVGASWGEHEKFAFAFAVDETALFRLFLSDIPVIRRVRVRKRAGESPPSSKPIIPSVMIMQPPGRRGEIEIRSKAHGANRALAYPLAFRSCSRAAVPHPLCRTVSVSSSQRQMASPSGSKGPHGFLAAAGACRRLIASDDGLFREVPGTVTAVRPLLSRYSVVLVVLRT